MSNISKEARRDAQEYARAEMFYGEGAGTRRKLIAATVESKMYRNPAYARAFEAELARQDMAEHAQKARKERQRKDAAEVVTRNTKAIATGNYQNVQGSVAALLVAGYFAHQTGLDKKALEEGKKLYAKGKERVRRFRAERKIHHLRSID